MLHIDFDATVPDSEANRRCRLCGQSDFEPFLTVRKGHGLAEDLTMVKCRSCHSAYYLGDNPVVGYAGTDDVNDSWYGYAQIGAGITAMLEPLLAVDRPRRGDLLDVGCGFGFIPHFWQTMGYGEAVGLEASYYGVVGREKLGIDIIHQYYGDADAIHGRRFSYVFSSEVIEHTPDPAAFLAEIGQGLADDGILILTTPSATGLVPETGYARLVAMLSPTAHYFLASKDALTALLRDAGYPHVLVRDTGLELRAWASRRPLPPITDGFHDWSTYYDYLERLSAHEDKHIASGAMYRLLRDTLNQGLMERARAVYPRFEALAREGFDLDFADLRASEARRRARSASDPRIFPHWMGCAIFFAGLYQQRIGGDPERQHALFTAAVETMKADIAITPTTAVEPTYFLPLAEAHLVRMQAARAGSKIRTVTLLKPLETITRGDVCILSVYAPQGRVLAGTRHYIDTLNANGVTVIACLAVEDDAAPVDSAQLSKAAAILTRENVGYDFGMWADILRVMPDLWQAQRLILANDSVLVIPSQFCAMMDRVRATASDVVALTDCAEPKYHTQSYFTVLQNAALTHPGVRSFFDTITDMHDKLNIINRYEVELNTMISDSDQLKSDVLFSTRSLFPRDEANKMVKWNPTHFFWDRLLDRGFPFIKLELLRDNPMGIQLTTVYAQLEMYGIDAVMVREHVAQSKRERQRNDIGALRSQIAHLEKNDLASAFASKGFLGTLRAMNRLRLKLRKARRKRRKGLSA